MNRIFLLPAWAALAVGAIDAGAQAPTPSATESTPDAATTPSVQPPASEDAAYSGTDPATSVPAPWESDANLDAERRTIWQSPEMKAARDYVRQYSQRSRQFTPEQAEQYLGRLRQMSPASMKKWLEEFRVLQERRSQAESVARAVAHQTAVQEAVRRLQTAQESYDAIDAGSSGAALTARDQLAQQQAFRDAATRARRANRNAFIADAVANDYSWIYNPDWYTKQAAAASLPGDLPRSDPRNFIRGDVNEPIEDGGIEGPAAAAAAAAAAAGSTAPAVPTPGG